MRRLHVLLALSAGCAASSGAPGTPAAPRRYVAPTRETVVASLEESNGTIYSALLYVDNRSSVPITVTGVTLRNCENIKQQCGTNPMRWKVDPDSRIMVLRIEQKLEGQGHGFGYTFAWHADSASATALKVMAEAGSAEATDRLAAAKHGEEIRRLDVGAADEELYPADVARLGDRIVTLRGAPDSLVLKTGTMVYVGNLRVLAIGATGEVLGRFRGTYRFRIPPGAVRFAPPDSLIAITRGRSRIEILPQPVPGDPRTKPLPPVTFTLVVP